MKTIKQLDFFLKKTNIVDAVRFEMVTDKKSQDLALRILVKEWKQLSNTLRRKS